MVSACRPHGAQATQFKVDDRLQARRSGEPGPVSQAIQIPAGTVVRGRIR